MQIKKGYAMARQSFTLSDEASKKLEEIAEETGKPLASLLREAVEVYLEKMGLDVDASVKWGGYRNRENDKPSTAN
jgi:predicted DNA-binding protein